MRIRVEALGCRLNTSEIEKISRQLAEAGHQIVESGESADMCIFNTCTVTQIAARKSRQLIRHLKRSHPGAAVVVTGCYAQMEPDEVAALGVDMVVGNQDKERLPQMISQRFSAQVQPARSDSGLPCLFPGARTRAFVKVQDGCDNRCTYCVVTVARGPGRSLPTGEVLAEVQGLVSSGYREVVLTGVHLASYGHDLGDRQGLFSLVIRLLQDTGVDRLRLSSLEPWDLVPEFFSLWQDKRMGRHLHIPLQSGCDDTLRRMARRITTEKYAWVVEAARAAIPDLSVTTDIMLGFPGESDAEFDRSLEFVERMAFSKLHVFRYSPRPGTAAASMEGQVPSRIAAERSQCMQELGAGLEQSFRGRFVGRRLDVLWETSRLEPEGLMWSGLTDNYLRVSAPGTPGLRNTITPTDLLADTPSGLRGRMVIGGQDSAGVSIEAPGPTSSR